MSSPTPLERVQATGNLVSATLLALDRGLKPTNPALFAECSLMLHEALNELTKLMFQIMPEDVATGDGS